MNKAFLNRTELLIGREKMELLAQARVILFGVGGVGSWCAEGLIRSGIEHLTIVDSDRICATNINRQVQATSQNIGAVKVVELRNRLLDINPSATITAIQEIYNKETSSSFNLESYQFIIDAIDSLSNKIHLIESALNTNSTLFSSMGAALKMDPTNIKIDSIWKTHGCPLAREIRRALRKRNIKNDFLCVYSEEVLSNAECETSCGSEQCICPASENGPGNPDLIDHEWCSQKVQINGSLVHITAVFGFMLAGLVIQSIVDN